MVTTLEEMLEMPPPKHRATTVVKMILIVVVVLVAGGIGIAIGTQLAPNVTVTETCKQLGFPPLPGDIKVEHLSPGSHHEVVCEIK
jgi:hypothetical protein